MKANTNTLDAKQRRALTIKVNYLLRARAVQLDYQREKREGIPDAFIWRKHIQPRHFIGLDTFYRYLTVNVSQELRKAGIAPETVLG